MNLIYYSKIYQNWLRRVRRNVYTHKIEVNCLLKKVSLASFRNVRYKFACSSLPFWFENQNEF